MPALGVHVTLAQLHRHSSGRRESIVILCRGLALSAILNVVAGNSPVLGVAGEMDNYVDDCAGCDGDHVRDDTEVNPKLSTQHRQREEDADQD